MSDEAYHTQQLLGRGCEKQVDGPAKFLSQQLQKLESAVTRSDTLSWTEWLQKATGARLTPAIANGCADSLSAVMLAIVKKDSATFLGALQAYWDNDYEGIVRTRPGL